MSPPAPESSIVLEQLPEIFNSLLKVGCCASFARPGSFASPASPAPQINDGKWRSIAEYQRATVFSDDQAVITQQAKQCVYLASAPIFFCTAAQRLRCNRLAKTYNLDTLDALFPEDPICAMCGEPAVHRCSRCKTEWYCRR